MTPWFERYVLETGLLRELPFYAAVLSQLDCVVTTQVPVMAVRWCGARFTLLVNDGYFARHPDCRAGVLLHEIHHLVLGHLVHPRFFDVASPHCMLLAMETSANEYVPFPLPQPLRWQDFRHLGLAAHQSTAQRYELLVRGEVRHGLLAWRTFDDHDGGHGGRPHAGGAAPLGIADVVHGRALPGAAAAVLQLLLERARRVAAHLQPAVATADLPRIGHAGLRDGVLAGRRLAKATTAAGGTRGPLLGAHDLDGLIADLASPPALPALDWRAHLRSFAGSAPRVSWHRPNRRQPARLFEVPGRSWRDGDKRLLVAIDTSGSMSDATLQAIAHELRGIAEHAAVTIVECDDRVRRVHAFAGELTSMCGRGGTDLRVPFAPELLRRHGRDGVVYFTDGQGPYPQHAPGVPVLWVLTSPQPFGCPWGRRVRLPAAAALDDVPF